MKNQQQQLIKQAKFTYSSLGKAFEKQIKATEDQGEKQFGSYSVSNIQDYFEYIFKKHGENIDKPSEMIYLNKIENRITFKIKDGYSLESLTSETM